jgi:hypothetical protein
VNQFNRRPHTRLRMSRTPGALRLRRLQLPGTQLLRLPGAQERNRASARHDYQRHRERRRKTTKRWLKLHSEHVKEQRRQSKYQRRYGITLKQYEILLEAQNGVCAICRRPPGKYRLCVDHDHVTGRVRGLLCQTCNRWLGYVEIGDRLERTVEYLRREEKVE